MSFRIDQPLIGVTDCVSEYLLEMVNIQKSFGNNQVLKGVDFALKPGEIHALLGKNGAGKTTLVKILNGVTIKDSGTIRLMGSSVEINSVKQAQQFGISMVYQDLSLYPNLTVAENILLGSSREFTRYGLIDKDKMVNEAGKVLERFQFKINPEVKVAQLGFGQQQMVEIARAVSQKANILILDEPTAALNEQEVKHFFSVLRTIQHTGVAIIYISHRLQEIKEIAQRVTILRDGMSVASRDVKSVEGEEIIKLMVGEEALGRYPRLGLPTRKELLRVDNLSLGNVLSDISFSLHEGEILGIAGMAGSGRTALVDSIFGIESLTRGRIFLRGREIRIKSPRQAIKLGFAYLSEDRIQSGLFYNLSIKSNIASSNLRRVAEHGVIDEKKERKIAQGLLKRLGMAAETIQQRVMTLSGGNQQKIMIAKWLFSGGYIYLLDEPTCGLDIASKVDVYNIINSMICGGSGVVMISSDLSELIGMCHRVLVIYKGTCAGVLEGSDISEEKILRLASGRE